MNGLPASKPTVDRRGLLSFLLITFAITYAIEGALILGGFRIVRGERALGQYVILAVMWVPALATVLTVRFVTREGFGIANVRVGSWRPYVAVGLIIPCCFVLIYALTWMLGLGQPDWSLHDFQRLVAGGSSAKVPPMPSPAVILPGLYAATLLFAPFVNGLFGFGEELGWRGYLLPKLLPLGRRWAHVLVGIIWGLWHLPLVLVGFAYPGHPILGTVLFVILTIAFGTYLDELTLKHRSSVLAGWGHGVFNSQKLGVWPMLFPDVDPLFGGYAGAVGLAIWIALGARESRR
jgi:hypothetical protein